jgi:tetratricopeptide (TPR) repeat protein
MPVTTDSKLALEFYETGMLAYDQIKVKLAYHNLELAVKEDPDFFMAYFWMYFISGNSTKEVANKAMLVETELSDGEMEIRSAFKYLIDGQDEKVVEHLRNAIDLYPGDPHVHKILYILQLHFIKDVESAVESIHRAIEVCPDFAPAYNQLGYALMYMEKYDEAEEAFDTYIRLSPNTANPYDSKGDYYMATKQYELAYKSYMKAYEIDPSFLVSEKKALKAIGLYNSSKK